MAAALRFAARKICGCTFQRQPPPYFTAAAEAAVKEEYRRLLPKINHAGIARRRLSSSEAPNPVNNNKVRIYSFLATHICKTRYNFFFVYFRIEFKQNCFLS
jgi:hypothetical protein